MEKGTSPIGRKDQSRLIKLLCQKWGFHIPEVAIAKAIASTFPDLQRLPLPINIEDLAWRRGIKKIIAADIDCEGLISIVSKGEYNVTVNSKLSEVRRRFTIGHEIGHTLFFDLEEKINPRLTLRDSKIEEFNNVDKSEESLCNFVASELLMPKEQIASRFRTKAPSAKSVLQMSKRFKTSIHATSLRVADICPYNLMICLWNRKENTQFYETDWVSRRVSYFRPLNQKLFITEDQPIYKTFESGTDFQGKRWASLGGPLEHYFVDIAPINIDASRILTVFVLEKGAEFLMEKYVEGKHSHSEQLNLTWD